MKQQLLKIALALAEHYQNKTAPPEILDFPQEHWEQCKALHRKLRICYTKGWSLAAKTLQRQYTSATQSLICRLSQHQDNLPWNSQSVLSTSAREIYSDLGFLEEEFSRFAFDLRSCTLSVTTEPITLESIELGEFLIELTWSDELSYQVIAQQPNPARSDDSVTHPHLQNEDLCEGDGRHLIKQALDQGRLSDFFQIVTNILRTYNSSSPYVSLDEWHGVICSDCGSSNCADDNHDCAKCSTTICGHCYYGCPGCDHSYCNSCVVECKSCDQMHCAYCIRQCENCQTNICPSCIYETERCHDCHEELEEEKSEDQKTTEKPVKV
ncbi:MAG: hypothetical protein COA78_30575 [Blastopirellula sp.]|nr:MAG: hypothetical protein COA78_30575 [Blastopirellula sp.]